MKEKAPFSKTKTELFYATNKQDNISIHAQAASLHRRIDHNMKMLKSKYIKMNDNLTK